ncbi:MAG: hypothetical protein ABI036_06665 [Fibrobacteria bacterium]
MIKYSSTLTAASRPFFVLFPALLLAWGSTAAAQGPSDSSVLSPSYQGSAFDIERNVPAYSEEHVEKMADGVQVGTRTVYMAPGGGPMAIRTLDFSHSPLKPDYLFKDVRNGYEEGSRQEAGVMHVHFRDNSAAPLREKSITVPEPCVVNGGVGNFVKEHWVDLASGSRLAFNMVVPARLDYFRFRAYRDVKKNLPEKETAGRKSQAIVIEPQSSVLRMLLPTIIMYYDVKTLRLVRYQGIVNVADPKGRSLRVRVDYPGLGP